MEKGNLRYQEFEFDSYDCTAAYGGPPGTLKSDWPLFILNRPLDNVAYIAILEVQIPFSYYVFNNQNNTFKLKEDTGVPVNIVIPIGNYNSSTLATELQTLLTAASSHSWTYTVTYSTLTQKFTISNNAPASHFFTLIFGTTGQTEGNFDPSIMLGANQTQFSTTSTGTGSTLTMPNAALISGPNYIYVLSDTIGNFCDSYLPAGAENLGNLSANMTKIPVNTGPEGVITYQNTSAIRWFKVTIGNIPSIDFYLSLGNWTNQVPLKLNGQSFSIKLGMLIEERTVDEALSGGRNSDYVVSRAGPKRRRQE